MFGIHVVSKNVSQLINLIRNDPLHAKQDLQSFIGRVETLLPHDMAPIPMDFFNLPENPRLGELAQPITCLVCTLLDHDGNY